VIRACEAGEGTYDELAGVVDVAARKQKRAVHGRWRRTVDAGRLIFIDEAGTNLAMGGSHGWVQKGAEYVEPRPMNC
jgi:hypothetical protein